MGGGIGGLADDLRPRFSPAGESPAARQIRLAEMDEEDNPTVVVEQEKPLPQAQSDPCPSCGVCSDLRSKFTDVRGCVRPRGSPSSRMGLPVRTGMIHRRAGVAAGSRQTR